MAAPVIKGSRVAGLEIVSDRLEGHYSFGDGFLAHDADQNRITVVFLDEAHETQHVPRNRIPIPDAFWVGSAGALQTTARTIHYLKFAGWRLQHPYLPDVGQGIVPFMKAWLRIIEAIGRLEARYLDIQSIDGSNCFLVKGKLVVVGLGVTIRSAEDREPTAMRLAGVVAGSIGRNFSAERGMQLPARCADAVARLEAYAMDRHIEVRQIARELVDALPISQRWGERLRLWVHRLAGPKLGPLRRGVTGAAKLLNFFAPLLERPYPALLVVVLVVSLLSGMASAWWFATLGGFGAGVLLREIVCWLRRASGTRPESASSAATKPMTELKKPDVSEQDPP